MADENKGLPSDAIAALEHGNRIEAIKCVRIAHGVGLKEAKELVEQFEGEGSRAKATDGNNGLPSDAIAALRRGSKIDAIKCVRVARGVGLKDAKDIVEQFLEDSPRIKSQMVSANMEDARGRLGWFLLAAVIAVAAYYLLGGLQ